MYLPRHFEETRLDALHGLIRQHPLGLWVTTDRDSGEWLANPLPFHLDASHGPHGRLLCHVARANPVWRSFATATPALVVFQGPQAYVSPNWYPSKKVHGKAVPTWNYVMVQATGRPAVVEDRAQLRELLEILTRTHESTQPEPWQIGDAPADYLEAMMNAVVAIEIPIDTLRGKWKVSQNRSAEDRAGVAQALDGQDMARCIRDAAPPSLPVA